MINFPSIPDVLPEGEHGEAKVVHIQISKDDVAFSRIRAIQHGRNELVSAGRFAQLKVDGSLVMSDTDMERRSNWEVLHEAKGDVLIAGLGLGMILYPILQKGEVKKVEVIEKSQDVIDLVGPTVRKWRGAKSKLSIIQADALGWKPPKGQKWDTIYFDIWSEISTENLDEISMLHKRFARRKNTGGWMGSWMQEQLKYQRRQERKHPWY